MALATWPFTLPQRFLATSFVGAGPDSLLRSEVQKGVDKVRPKSSAMAKPVSGSMTMTDQQLQDFVDFFEANLGKPFWFPQPRQGAEPWLARFETPYEYTHQVPSRWVVAFKLEILP